MMNSYFKLKFHKHDLTAGFTLLELLVASAMTLMVVTISGIGLVQIMKGNIESEIDSQIQYDLNRTAEFISKEIKTSLVSTQPQTDASSNTEVTTHANIPSDAKYVLLLKNQDLSAPIVYYTLPRNSTSITQSWLPVQGQTNLVLYRWGPGLDSTGNQYTSPNNPSAWGSPVPIADVLSATSITGSCPSTWTLIPNSATTEGFNICVKPRTTTATEGKQVKLRLTSKVKSDRLSQDKQQPDGDEVKYTIETEVYSRVSN